MQLEPQSGRNLQPQQRSGITQVIRVNGVPVGKGTSLKLRWKASYTLGGAQRQEQGELSSLGVP